MSASLSAAASTSTASSTHIIGAASAKSHRKPRRVRAHEARRPKHCGPRRPREADRGALRDPAVRDHDHIEPRELARGQSVGAPWDGRLQHPTQLPPATAITSAGRARSFGTADHDRARRARDRRDARRVPRRARPRDRRHLRRVRRHDHRAPLAPVRPRRRHRPVLQGAARRLPRELRRTPTRTTSTARRRSSCSRASSRPPTTTAACR